MKKVTKRTMIGIDKDKVKNIPFKTIGNVLKLTFSRTFSSHNLLAKKMEIIYAMKDYLDLVKFSEKGEK